MAFSNALALAAGGIVVVALSFGAGMLGGSTTGGGKDVSPAAPRVVPDSIVISRLDEFDRRLGNVEERLRIVEETAEAALARTSEIDALRRALDALRTGGSPPPPAVAPSTGTRLGTDDGAVAPLTDEERERREAEQIAKLREDARKIVLRYAPGLMKQRLTRIADASEQGAADRRSQVYADTKQLAVQYSMTPEQEDTLREILADESEAAVRDVAPYLGGGLERADFGAVKEKLGAIWDRRDARMSEVLDTQELEEYRETQKEWRAVYSKVLDDMAAARRER